MKKMLKLLYSPLIILFILSFTLSGCGKSAEVTDPKTTAEVTTTQKVEEKVVLEPTNITMYFIGTNAMSDDKKVDTAITEYLKDTLNIKFKQTHFDWGSWDQKMNLLMASGEPIDLLFQASWLGAAYSTNISKGYLLPLDELIEKNAKEAKEIIPSILFDDVKSGGKIYGVPTFKEIGSAYGFVFNKKLVDKYKFDITIVKNWEDAEEFFKTIKENEKDITPLSGGFIGLRDNQYVENYLSPDIPVVIERGVTPPKAVIKAETEWFKSGCLLMQKYYNAGYIPKDIQMMKDSTPLIKAGKVFCVPEPLKPGKDKEDSLKYGIDFVQQQITEVYSGGDGLGSMLSIGANCKDPDRAMMFINQLFTDKKLVNMLAFGIEGTHFEKKADNIIDYPAGKDANSIGYNHGIQWEFGNQYLNYLFANEDPQKWEKFKAFSTNTVPSRFPTFSFNADSVKTQIATVTNVKKQYEEAITSGIVKDMDASIKKYVDELKKAGIDLIVAEYQKQIDEYMANKK